MVRSARSASAGRAWRRVCGQARFDRGPVHRPRAGTAGQPAVPHRRPRPVTTNGEIEYHGRADAEVKIRGHRVDLGEIEIVLLEDPTARRGRRHCRTHRGWCRAGALAAYVVRGPEIDTNRRTGERLHERMRTAAARLHGRRHTSMWSRRCRPCPAARWTANGCPRPAGSPAHRYRARCGRGQRHSRNRVAAVWAEALGLLAESLSVEADFFDELGGHSLLAARVVSRLRGARIRREPGSPRSLPATRPCAAWPSICPTRPRRGGHRTAATGAAPTAGGRGSRAGQAVVLYLLLFVITLPVAYVYTWQRRLRLGRGPAQLLAAILISISQCGGSCRCCSRGR